MVLVVARKVELEVFADQDISLLRNCSQYSFIVDALSTHRYLFHHSFSLFVITPDISVFSSVSCTPFSVMVNLR